MNPHTVKGNAFLTSERLTAERLQWLIELLKYYSTRLYPESFHHNPRTPTPPFTFFLLGDACYSLIDRQHHHLWEILFRLPCFRCGFDPMDLRLRKISIEPFRVRYPDQIVPSTPGNTFQDTLLDTPFPLTPPASLGFLLLHTPYMYRTAARMIDLFQAAVRRGISPEFYGYLDGVHAAHCDQQPQYQESIGKSLSDLYDSATRSGLSPLYLACDESASSRGYSTFRGDKGRVVSASLIPHVRIKELDEIADRFCRRHRILSHTSFTIGVVTHRRIPRIGSMPQEDIPPLVILVTHGPYGTEFTKGALNLAAACAHREIPTRVVFIEEGIYSLTGQHSPTGMLPDCDLQSLIGLTKRLDNLEYYAHIPSMQVRGISGDALTKNVCAVTHAELSQVLLLPPAGLDVEHQRVLVF